MIPHCSFDLQFQGWRSLEVIRVPGLLAFYSTVSARRLRTLELIAMTDAVPCAPFKNGTRQLVPHLCFPGEKSFLETPHHGRVSLYVFGQNCVTGCLWLQRDRKVFEEVQCDSMARV